MAKLLGLIPMAGDGTEKAALRKSQEMAQNYQNMYDQYMPQSVAALWSQYTNPNTPFHRAQMNTFGADTMQNFQSADSQLQRSLANRGIGNSSFSGNNLGLLWQQYGNTMANARQQQMGELENRRMQALQGVMGAASNAGNMALGAWDRTGQMAAARGQEQMNGLKQFGSLLGGYVAGLPAAAGHEAVNTLSSAQQNIVNRFGGISPISAPTLPYDNAVHNASDNAYFDAAINGTTVPRRDYSVFFGK